MTTVAKADKSRLTIRGLVDGEQYLVREQPGGWFITPEKKHRVKKTGMSADTFARLYRFRTPLDADTAKLAAHVFLKLLIIPGLHEFRVRIERQVSAHWRERRSAGWRAVNPDHQAVGEGRCDVQ